MFHTWIDPVCLFFIIVERGTNFVIKTFQQYEYDIFLIRRLKVEKDRRILGAVSQREGRGRRQGTS